VGRGRTRAPEDRAVGPFVGHLDWSFASTSAPESAIAAGLARVRIIGADHGAANTDLWAGSLEPAGWLAPHVHTYEEALVVMSGELLVRIGDRVHRLVAGDHALFQIGTRHGLGNDGAVPARWISLNAPQKVDPSDPRQDTFYEAAQDLAEMAAEAGLRGS
jgi:quercetin dioxygenase-like cupin family protein